MKGLFKKLETMMAAVAFAEAGEVETARQILDEERPRRTKKPVELKQVRPTSRKMLRAA